MAVRENRTIKFEFILIRRKTVEWIGESSWKVRSNSPFPPIDPIERTRPVRKARSGARRSSTQYGSGSHGTLFPVQGGVANAPTRGNDV
jgi:hypothetical protein